ncbi:MAG: hypothetical protein HY744_04790 [Deltaproteobacteria bacterium]|nr:hypothetical protein [Deltaproteobacteria bacterium]
MTTKRSLWLGGCLAAALCAASAAEGCSADRSSKGDQTGSSSSGGGSSSTSGTASGGGSSSGGGEGGSSTSTSSSGGGDITCGDGAVAATVEQIAKGDIQKDTHVKLVGVVAMSRKFLVTKSSKGSCLWGVFVSSPGLSETKEYSGLLAVSYGFNAETNDAGKEYCAALGLEPAGGKIPDEVKPGDVLDLIGTTDYFLLSNCKDEPGGSTVAQRQLAKVCQGEITGTAAVPKAKVLAANEWEDLGASNKADFHDKWGGVKVRLEGPSANTVDGKSVIGQYGAITLNEGGGLQVLDKLYYRGYMKSDPCYAGPQFEAEASPGKFTFTFIEGLSSMDYCFWRLLPNDKCADFGPPSLDCKGNAASCGSGPRGRPSRRA